MDKEIRADAKLKNLPPDILDTLWRLRNPDEELDKKHTYVEVLAWLKSEHGIDSSLGALSEFYSWLRLKHRIENAARRATQVRLELAKDSTITPDDLERIAQTVFTAETVENGDVEAFVKLATLRLNRQRVDQDERKLKILEAKAAKADAAEEVTNDGALTEEEKAARIKQIFRMG
ncbi:MAG: hypothetical protein Q8Q59_15835 [Luteolibacter sp.]|nr:hypothetical protein [Luteolibacter sp.]